MSAGQAAHEQLVELAARITSPVAQQALKQAVEERIPLALSEADDAKVVLAEAVHLGELCAKLGVRHLSLV